MLNGAPTELTRIPVAEDPEPIELLATPWMLLSEIKMLPEPILELSSIPEISTFK